MICWAMVVRRALEEGVSQPDSKTSEKGIHYGQARHGSNAQHACPSWKKEENVSIMLAYCQAHGAEIL